MNLLRVMLLLSVLLVSFAIQAKVAVIVNINNLDDINSQQIKKIFLGKAKAFPSGNKAKAFSLPDNDKSTVKFRQMALKKTNSQYKSHWAKLTFTGKGRPPKVTPAHEMLKAIVNTPNAIGFINADDLTHEVRLIAIY